MTLRRSSWHRPLGVSSGMHSHTRFMLCSEGHLWRKETRVRSLSQRGPLIFFRK
jgi:hypothetical protein